MSLAHAVFESASAAAPANAAASVEAADALIQRLLHVFGDKTLQRALTLVDQRGVSCVVAEATRRVLFQVKGHGAGEVYTCFPGHFCGCHAFFFDVVSKGEQTCKHMLAALLAHTLGRCNVFVVTDVEFARLLEQLEA